MTDNNQTQGDPAPIEQERLAVVWFLQRYAKGERKRAQAMRADAGTQAEFEARSVERVAAALEHAAEHIEAGDAATEIRDGHHQTTTSEDDQ